jgi:hypothetical protein
MSTEARKQVYRRRTPEQWRRVIAGQVSSGLSQQTYCTRRGIAYSSFCRWKRELSETEPPAKVPISTAFVELTPAAAARWEVELELGEGVYLRLRRG